MVEIEIYVSSLFCHLSCYIFVQLLIKMNQFLSYSGRVLYDEGEDCDESKFTDAIVHIALREYHSQQ